MKSEYFLTPYTKTNSKWIKDLNARPETIKLLDENRSRTLYDINHSKIFYDPSPKSCGNKNTSRWDLIRLKIFCTAKETINQVEIQPSECKTIIANETTDKRLISKICSISYKSIPEKQTIQSKSGERLKQALLQ